MESLTVVEAFELIRVNEAALATQFETWLTITFATIVAAFAGRNLLTRLMRWLITILYLLASLSVTAMSIYIAESNAQLTALLESRGVTVVVPVFAGSVFFFLFLAGVLTTVYFIHMKSDREST